MKKAARWICPVVFLVLCAAVIWFLYLFTVTDETMTYIDWQSGVQIAQDGTETPYDVLNEYTSMPEVSGTFRFTAALPEGLGDGYLLFETSGLELSLSLSLGGEEIYSSAAVLPAETLGLSSANIPLPENAAGELTMVCTILDNSNAMFPPMVRFVPTGMYDTQSMAYANLYGIPAGLTALALLLVAGLFLLSILRQRVEWSLIPLALALVGLTFYRLVQSCGFYFLPEEAVRILSWQGFSLLAPLALAVYLMMNRRRDFWRLLGWAASWSAGALLAAYLVSLAGGWYLSGYINNAVSSLFMYGFYDGLLYWLTLWLSVACALISAYWFMRSLVRQQAETQALALKNQLILDSYRTVKQKIRDSAALRHEFRHWLTAMEALCQKEDYDGLSALLGEMKQQDAGLIQTQFTENFTVNAILQDVASRAVQAGIAFDAQVHVPAELTVPESDACVLLMNMLDNALEACAKVSRPEDRFIRFKAEVKNGFFAIKCENSYAGELKEDKRGRLLTTKEEPEAHGFGLPQMSAVAERYHSLLDVSFTDDHVFIIQTALKLPKKKTA